MSFPELAEFPLPSTTSLFNSEVVAFADGAPSFAALAERMHVSRADRAKALAERIPVTLLLFDVLGLGGRDLLDEPLVVRRQVLGELDLQHDRWQTPPVYDVGQMLFDATYQQGLEGIVSGTVTGRYQPGPRSKDWLKFAHVGVAGSFVVGGWRRETDSQDRLVASAAPGRRRRVWLLASPPMTSSTCSAVPRPNTTTEGSCLRHLPALSTTHGC